MERRRETDLDIEHRLSTLESQRISDDQRMREYHQANQNAIAAIKTQVELSNSKMDLMLEAVHMAKGGWWAAGKIIGLFLGIVSGFAGIASFAWWAISHVSIKPAVAAVLVAALLIGVSA